MRYSLCLLIKIIYHISLFPNTMSLNLISSSLTPVVREIATDEDPFLKQVAVEVEDIRTQEVQQLIADMIETMYAAKGIGLAAPQIRVLSRVVVFYLPESRDDTDSGGVPVTVLINPNIEPLGEEIVSDFEGLIQAVSFLNFINVI